jgi:hypothetical protein
MQGLATWIARRLNQLIGRRGKVFADRFHAHVLRTPLEVARAVAYSSVGGDGPALTAAPRTLLLRRGWRRAH